MAKEIKEIVAFEDTKGTLHRDIKEARKAEKEYELESLLPDIKRLVNKLDKSDGSSPLTKAEYKYELLTSLTKDYNTWIEELTKFKSALEA